MGSGELVGETVQSDETLFRIIEGLKQLNGAGVTELADEYDLSKSTVHRHLNTLRHHEFVFKEGETYRLGLRFLEVGGYVRARSEMYEVVRPKVRQLAEDTSELIQFIVEDHGYGIFVFREQGSKGVETEARIGKRVHLNHLSAGKAILAHLPEEKVNEIIERRGLPSKTQHTITDEAELFDELDAIRDQGYAFDMGEHIEGLWAVGAPVHTPDGDVLGALSIAGPTHRMKGEWYKQELPEDLLATINEIELNITYS